jgi:hypothetical protein
MHRLWMVGTTVPVITRSLLRMAKPLSSGSSFFCFAAGAPHYHFLGHSITTIPVKSERPP